MASDAQTDDHVIINFDEEFVSDEEGTLSAADAMYNMRDSPAVLSRSSAHIEIVIHDHDWGVYNDRPACMIKLSMVSVARPRRISLAVATLFEASDGVAKRSDTVRVATWHPETASGPLEKTIRAENFTFSPQAQVLGNSGSLGSVGAQMDRPVQGSWKFAGTTYKQAKGVRFSLTENHLLEDGVPVVFRMAAIFIHRSVPFIIDFNAEGRTRNPLGDGIAILRKAMADRVDSRRRVFTPPPTTPAKTFTLADLEAWTNTSPHLSQQI